MCASSAAGHHARPARAPEAPASGVLRCKLGERQRPPRRRDHGVGRRRQQPLHREQPRLACGRAWGMGDVQARSSWCVMGQARHSATSPGCAQHKRARPRHRRRLATDLGPVKTHHDQAVHARTGGAENNDGEAGRRVFHSDHVIWALVTRVEASSVRLLVIQTKAVESGTRLARLDLNELKAPWSSWRAT